MFSLSPVDIAQSAQNCGWIAIDSEFVSEGHYQSLLCLVQVATETDQGQQIALLDPFDPSFDPQPICAVLADPKIEVILHAGRQDIAILKRTWNTTITNIFDTQIAAGFTGGRAQLSYTNLVDKVLKTRVPHSAGFTRWDRRPLTDKQQAYARSDVEYLQPLTAKLKQDLQQQQRLSWVYEECEFLSEVSDERNADLMLWKVPRINTVSGEIRAVTRELIAWRNELAKKHDKPPTAILGDATLLEIAKQQPQTEPEIREIRGVNEQFAHTHTETIIKTIHYGCQQQPIELPVRKRQQTKPVDSPVIAFCEAFIRAKACAADIAYELLASRSDLEQIVGSFKNRQLATNVRTLQGWRKDLVGNELLELLAGKQGLQIDENLQLEVCQANIADDSGRLLSPGKGK